MLGNPTQGPRIVPFGAARTDSDRLPNGRPSFRVTQRYADTDIFFGGRHGAIDLGNFYCGDILLAAVAGSARTYRDPYGALCCDIRMSDGTVVGYGHLSKFAVATGAYVRKGQVIGYVGDTGLGGICHVHFSVTRNGYKLDPWPLLDQNIIRYRTIPGAPVNIRSGAGLNAAIYAVQRSDGIYRLSDNVRLAIGHPRLRYRRTVRGSDGYNWDELYLNSAYGRYVRSNLLRIA